MSKRVERCRLTLLACEEARECAYGVGAAGVRVLGVGKPASARVNVCQVAIDGGYNSCRQCLDKARCAEVFRCFRKTSLMRRIREERRTGRRVFGSRAAAVRVPEAL